MAASTLEKPRRSALTGRARPRLEGCLVLGVVGLFSIVLALSVVTVPTHFSTTVGATHASQQFRANDQVEFHWQTSDGQATLFTLTNEYQNISLEDGVGSPSMVVYQTTASSGSYSFVADGAPYTFACACATVGSVAPTVQVVGTIATPLL